MIGPGRTRRAVRLCNPAVAAGLVGLLAAGIGLRAALMITRSPAFLGAPDSNWYIGAARNDLFLPPTWPVGYQLLLRVLHAIDDSLTFAIGVQHALGIATALLLFLAVRAVAAPGWGLVPAGVVLLAGPQLLVEHTPLSDALFTFLVAACCYCTVRGLCDGRPEWAGLAGLAAAGSACVRPVGLPLAVVAVVCLAAGAPGDLRRRLRLAGTAALIAGLVVSAHAAATRYEAGYVDAGLVRAGGWNMYARVAPFADCRRFSLPAAARRLCEDRPVSERPTSARYLEASPATRLFGTWFNTQPEDDRAMIAFARAAVLHQPGAYLRAVASDLSNFWSTNGLDPSAFEYTGVSRTLIDRVPQNVAIIREWYATGDRPTRPGAPEALLTYERHTRLQGPAFVALLLLAVAGIPLSRGRRLASGLLFLGVSVVTLVGPVATVFFYTRYAIPGYGPLAAAGAVGAASLWERFAARRAADRAPSAAGVSA
jgi:4-amino-4-deoxy-L-arabinose transferase-like glycosyltransferase